MADTTNTITRIFTTAVTAITSHTQGVRGTLRGKDFMLDDQTFGADRDGR
jgi:hypothetical protein